MNVLVAGGTGFIGRNLCAALDERGHDVTAMARTPDESVLPAGVETVAGDVTAYDSIEGAFEGKDAVVNLVSLSPLFKPPEGASHEAVHLGGTKNVVRAAEEHGVEKILQMSGLQADPYGPTAYLRAKGRAEEVVRESDLRWTILRPSVVFGEGDEFLAFTRLLTTPYVTGLPGGGTMPFQPIWIGDLAPMMVDALEPEHDGEVYELGGPEVLRLTDIVRLLQRAEGKTVTIVPVPMFLARLGLTLADPLPFVPLGVEQYRSLSIDSTTPENDIGAFGVHAADLMTLSEYIKSK